VAIQQSSAKELLDSAEKARRKTRSILSSNWFPMILFGVLALASVPVNQIWSPIAMAALWLVGAPLATLATGLWYRTRESEAGVSVIPLPYALTAIGIIAGCIVFGIVGRGGVISYAGPITVIGLGYVGFAVLDRSVMGAMFGAAMAAAGIVVFAFRPSHAYAVTMLLFGCGAVFLGLWNLLHVKRVS
jgi:hypothetical protein